MQRSIAMVEFTIEGIYAADIRRLASYVPPKTEKMLLDTLKQSTGVSDSEARRALMAAGFMDLHLYLNATVDQSDFGAKRVEIWDTIKRLKRHYVPGGDG
jgi:hypothetical protein